jgi:hypothetical protein
MATAPIWEAGGVGSLRAPVALPGTHARHVSELRASRAGEHALVIGNSPWRKGFPLEAWKGPTIGCNAIWKDSGDGETKGYIPDYICAIDTDVISELIREGMGTKTILILRAGEARHYIIRDIPKEKLGVWYVVGHEIDFKTLTGGMAIMLAGYLGCASATLVGFSGSDANLYIGTANYAKREHHPEPGALPTAMTRMYQAFDKFRELSPEGTIHIVAPEPFVMRALATLAPPKKD